MKKFQLEFNNVHVFYPKGEWHCGYDGKRLHAMYFNNGKHQIEIVAFSTTDHPSGMPGKGRRDIRGWEFIRSSKTSKTMWRSDTLLRLVQDDTWPNEQSMRAVGMALLMYDVFPFPGDRP